MMTFEHMLAIAAFALVTLITPGPNNLMLMASGTNFGIRRTVPHLLGVTIGFTSMLAMIGIGIAQVFDIFPQSYILLKALSVTYLLYLAWKIATAASISDAKTANAKPFTFLQAAAFQWVNPKAWTMCLSAVSVYTLPESPNFSLAIMVGIFCVICLPSNTFWAVLGTHVRRFLNAPAKLRAFNWLCAALLVATLYPILM